MNDASGKPVNDRGKYVEIWEKQADGKWKVVASILELRSSGCDCREKVVRGGLAWRAARAIELAARTY